MPLFGDRTDRRTRFVLIAILLLAFALRIFYLDQKSLWWDESTTLNHIRYGFRFVLTNQMKWGENLWLDNHLPLYFVFMYFFVRLSGTTDFAIRYPSVAWGVLLCVLLYAMGKKLVNKKVGLLAALIGALSPFYIWFSQSARLHILVPLLGLLSVYLLWQILEGKPWFWHVAFVASNAALLFTNILGLSLVLFEGLAIVVYWLRHRNWRPVISMAAVTLCALPVIRFGLVRSGRQIRQEMLPFPTIFRDVVHSYNAGLSWSAPVLRWWDWGLLFVVVLGALMLVQAGRHERIKRSFFISGYALIPFLLLYVVPAINKHYMGSRYAVIGSPAYYLLLAVGLETLFRKVKWRAIPAASLVLVIFGVSIFRYFYVPPYTLHRGHDYRSAAQYVNAHAYPGDAIVGSPYSYDAFYRYIDSDLPWYGLPRRPYWDEETFVQDSVPEFEKLRTEYDRIWFIDADYLYVEQNRGITKAWLTENLVGFTVQPYAYVTVRGYMTQSPLLNQWPEIESPMDVTLDNLIRVKGLQILEREPQSGQKMRVELYLEALQDLDTDYGVAVRVRDAQGRVWGEKMEPVLAGVYSSSNWQRGQRFREWCDVQIEPGTPAGTYQLEVGFYKGSPYQELIAYDLEGSVIGPSISLGEVLVRSPSAPVSVKAIPMQKTLNVRWGREIESLGVDVSRTEVQAGEVVPFALYHQARADVATDYIVRFSLVGSKGNVEWTSESLLVSAPAPVLEWRSGEVLKGRYEFFVPPHIAAGHYRVTMQVLDAQGQEYSVHRPSWNPLPVARITLFDLDIEAREYETELPSISHPLQVSLGEWGELLGYDLARDTFTPGDTLQFTLYWRAHSPVAQAYKVFVHILGVDGHVGVQSDSMPANWSRPTYTWAPGEPIVDMHEILLPADMTPGEYNIVIGLYDEQTGVRVVLYEPGGETSDHLTLSALAIQPR